MKKTPSKIVLFLLLMATVCMISACGNPQLKVTYTVDGKKADEAPDRGLYEIDSIKTNNKDCNATWDCNTWSLKTDPLTKNTTVNLDFVSTKHAVTMNGIGYESLQDAFDAAGTTQAQIHVTKDLTAGGVSAVGCDITLYLHSHAIEGTGSTTIVNNGKMTIIGAPDAEGDEDFQLAKISNTSGSENESKTLVNFGTLRITNTEIDNTTSAFSVWNSNNGESSMEIDGCLINKDGSEIIAVVNSGIMTISNSTITGSGDNKHPVVLMNNGGGSLNVNGSSIVNNGSGYSVYRESGTVSIDSSSNCPNAFGLEDETAAPVTEEDTSIEPEAV